jgi:hypothetical protein
MSCLLHETKSSSQFYSDVIGLNLMKQLSNSPATLIFKPERVDEESSDGAQTTRRLVRAPWDCAQRLADLYSLSFDLEFCVECCDRLVQGVAGNCQDVPLEQALWTAALISYSRCFASGRRFGLSESTFEDQDPLAVKLHKSFRATRDKYIAHSVSPFEQMEVGLILDAYDPPKEVVGTLRIHMRLLPDMATEAPNLKNLAMLVHRELQKIAADTEREVMERAKQTPFSEVVSFPSCTYIPPDWEAAATVRGKKDSTA